MRKDIGLNGRGGEIRRFNKTTNLCKTIFGILKMPPLNLFDAAASDLSDCFTDTPDFTPYEAIPIRKELFDAERAKPAQR